MAQEGIENIRSRLNRLGVPQPVIDNHLNAVMAWRASHLPKRRRLSFEREYELKEAELWAKSRAALARMRQQRRAKMQERRDEAYQNAG
jgi:hypothetical protein